MSNKTRPARVDADGKSVPYTRLVGHVTMADFVNRTRYKSLDKLASYHVVEVWDEDDDGLWARLAPEYTTSDGTSCLHEFTVAELLRRARTDIEKGDFYLQTPGDRQGLE